MNRSVPFCVFLFFFSILVRPTYSFRRHMEDGCSKRFDISIHLTEGTEGVVAGNLLSRRLSNGLFQGSSSSSPSSPPSSFLPSSSSSSSSRTTTANGMTLSNSQSSWSMEGAAAMATATLSAADMSSLTISSNYGLGIDSGSLPSIQTTAGEFPPPHQDFL